MSYGFVCSSKGTLGSSMNSNSNFYKPKWHSSQCCGQKWKCAQTKQVRIDSGGGGALAKFLGKLQKARYLWVLRTPQSNKEEGARAKKLVTCGTRGSLGRGQGVPFRAQGAYCSAPKWSGRTASPVLDAITLISKYSTYK